MRRALRSRILPEAELLLLAARGEEADDELRGLLGAKLDWDVALALVERARAHAALWPRLCAAGLDRIPETPREQLRRLVMVDGFRQANLEQRLDEVLGLFERKQIEVLLLKGSALAISVYGSFAARSMADLDLLVPAERAPQAQRLLLEHGWRLGDSAPAEVQEALYARQHHLPPLVNGPARIELHREPLPSDHPFRFSAAELWQASVLAKHRDRCIRIPALQHQALHLCLHLVWSHMVHYGAFPTLRDLRTLSELPAFDWQEHVDLARTARGASACYWAWRLARSLVGAPVPPDALEALAPERPTLALDLLERHFVTSLFGGVHCPSPRIRRTLWELAIAPERNGHGAARPWSRDVEFIEAGIGPEDRSKASWRNMRGWKRYLRALLFPRPPGAAAPGRLNRSRAQAPSS